jgi:hypothetical protein
MMKLKWWIPVLLFAAIATVGVRQLREIDRAGYRPGRTGTLLGGAQGRVSDAVGTSGRADTTAAHDSMAADPPALIRELETITGQVDGRALVGRHVDLHVPVAARANDQAFWVGEKDNRLLIVPERDHRDSEERQMGLIASHGIGALEQGKQAAVSGSIQKLPPAEEMFGWGLTHDDLREAAERGVYVRADRMSIE